MPLLAGGMPVFSRKWGMKPDGTRIPFDQLAFEKPIGSGPYLIERYDNGRTITYRRNPDYWGDQLPVRVGTYNFDRIDYKLYSDSVARLEAFKAGEYDVLVENVARNWVRRDIGKRFDSGELIKREFPQHNGSGMQGFFMNVRRPLFKDVRVRQALDLALDFEWLNRQLFFNQYKRTDSFFVNTDLQAKGTPERGELALLDAVARAARPGRVRRDAASSPTPIRPARCARICIKARQLLRTPAGPIATARCATRRASRSCSRFSTTRAAARRWSRSPRRSRAICRSSASPANFRTADYALIQKRLDAFDFDMTSDAHARRAGAGHGAGLALRQQVRRRAGLGQPVGREVAGRRRDSAARSCRRRRASNSSTPRTRSTGC